jgi:hypothetical protein
VESIGVQIALATSTAGLMDVHDIKSALDYFELLQRGGVINADHYFKNGVGAGIVTFNVVLTSILASRDNSTMNPESFGKVLYLIMLF